MVSEPCAMRSTLANGVSACSSACEHFLRQRGCLAAQIQRCRQDTSSSQRSTATRKLETMITMLAVRAKLTIKTARGHLCQ
jgi:hypothetical protein